MMTTTQSIKLYTFGYKELRTYLFAALFVVGNILLPQLCHLLPQGGLTWLPIYFFTLVAAYKYGWKVGLLTAVASPVINNLLFGMPGAAMLPIILVKSALVVAAATVATKVFKQYFGILTVAAVVVAYQLVGSLIEWGMTASLTAAVQDLTIGLPGILLQIVAGYLVIKKLS